MGKAECYQLKVTDSQSTRWIMCLLIIQKQSQRKDRCQPGRGLVILVLRLNREFAFEEILTLLRLIQLLPFPSLPPSHFFSLLFWHFSLSPAPSLPVLTSVSAPTAMVSAAQKGEERGPGWWLRPWRVESHAGALSLALSLASFHYPEAARPGMFPFL